MSEYGEGFGRFDLVLCLFIYLFFLTQRRAKLQWDSEEKPLSQT